MHEDWNGARICEYNVLNDYFIPTLKRIKRKSKNIKEFSEFLRSEMMWRYWSKCEWETIILNEDGKLTLKPLISRESQIPVDPLTDQCGMDWQGFYKFVEAGRYSEPGIKIDAYDQLRYRWKEFVEYCYNTHLPYERKREEEHLDEGQN